MQGIVVLCRTDSESNISLENLDRVPCSIDVGFQITKLGGVTVKDLSFDPIKAKVTGRKDGSFR